MKFGVPHKEIASHNPQLITVSVLRREQVVTRIAPTMTVVPGLQPRLH